MSTLLDPRSRTMSPTSDNGGMSPSQHPDLSNEVATLSNKLINAINHQTNLDDILTQTRHELDASRERIRHLEQENQEHVDMITRGILVEKATVDAEKNKLILSLANERRQRSEIEKEKKNIEQELENLTTALFEEANKMVITAREEAQKEHDTVQRRNDQLKAQLADTESLLKSHQDQLAELKQVMEQMTEERDDQTNPTAPSTPGLSKFDSKDESAEETTTLQSTSLPEVVSPTYPTSFTHLLQTVLRTDLSAYDDFTTLLKMSKNVMGSRVSSGSYGSIGLGLGLGSYTVSQQAPTNGSTSSLSTAGTFSSSPATPTTPASSVSAGSAHGLTSLTPLKGTKFYKRSLAEDIEPTLRLDSAPGLSWLARRTVLNAVCEGSLVVEPMPTSTKPYMFPCSLCGETRKDPAHTRSHRFRTNENENAQRYPLCKYCLGRVRSTCDFLGFLRVLKDGHWRADDEESKKAAWEESVRLREQMFWCRIGGGVIPASHHNHSEASARSPHLSEDEQKGQETSMNDELERSGEFRPRDITPVVDQIPSPTTKVLKRTGKVINRDETAEGLWEAAQEDAAIPGPIKKEDETADEDPVAILNEESSTEKMENTDKMESTEKQASNRGSTQSTSSLQIVSPEEGEKEGVKRLSITIPGSFD